MPEIVSYSAALRRINAITNEHYRQLSLGNDETKQFRDDVERLRQPAAEKRFHAVVRKGVTGGVEDMHYGHEVLDATYDIEQYGNKAKVHFISLDGMVSMGYMQWQTDGGGGSGGWNSKEGIYQIRPMYADGPVGDWLAVSDREVRETKEKEAADESKRDETRDPLDAPIGAKLRMDLESNDRLLSELHQKRGLTGDALRIAFIDRVRNDTFASSILAHEGRHAIDASRFVIRSSATLEFRAKLSEVAFAPDPRRAVTNGIFVQVDAASPHGQANRQIFEGLTKWMREHTPELAGLRQFDKLTDEQIKQAFRSMDPLAK